VLLIVFQHHLVGMTSKHTKSLIPQVCVLSLGSVPTPSPRGISVPTRNGRHTFIHMLPPQSCDLVCLCPPSLPCVYTWDPGIPWETHTIVSYNFLELLLHLVCHAPWSWPWTVEGNHDTGMPAFIRSIPSWDTNKRGTDPVFFCCSSRQDLPPPVFRPQYPSSIHWSVC
jgi:hypothetical protein